MTDFITKGPAWLSFLFVIVFSTIPVFLISNTVKKVLEKENKTMSIKIAKRIKIFYWSYFAVVGFLSFMGVFIKNTLPPLIIVCTVIPLFLFYVLYVQKRDWFQQVFKNITLEQLVFIHVFRFVGIFFFVNYFYEVLPKSFAYIGGIGDILTALLVFPVIYFLKHKKSYAKTTVWVWNFIGIIDIVSVLITAISITKIAIQNNEVGVAQFATFPFSWIPAFAPATIIFLHVLVFKKLIKKE